MDLSLRYYELLLRRNSEDNDFVYDDFIRPADCNISEIKHEIRDNITNYQMDKQVERDVNTIIHATGNNDLFGEEMRRDLVAVRVLWSNISHAVVKSEIGYYKKN